MEAIIKKYFTPLLVILYCSSLVASPPDWNVNPPSYQYNMVGIIRVLNLNNTFYNNPSTIIRVIVDDETRGVVQGSDIIFIDSEAYMPITIYSNQQVGETLHFEVYAPSEDSIYVAPETSIFDRNESLGNVVSPFILTIGLCSDILLLTSSNLPFRSFYKAGAEIQLQGPIIEITEELMFYTPILRVIDSDEISSIANITVNSSGCID